MDAIETPTAAVALRDYLAKRPRAVAEVLLLVQEVTVRAAAGVLTPITVRTSSAA